MGFIDIITKLFGNKSQKDMQAVMPYVEKIKAVYTEIDALSDDELRARSAALMQRLQDAVAADKTKILELKASIESIEIDKREKVYNEIDSLEKEVLDIYDKTLNDILPDAFAVVRKDYERAFGDGSVSRKWHKFFSLVSSAFRKEELLQNPFDETFQYSEDSQWVNRREVTIVYVPEAVVEHSHNYNQIIHILYLLLIVQFYQ